jgi:hypothetical protein
VVAAVATGWGLMVARVGWTVGAAMGASGTMVCCGAEATGAAGAVDVDGGWWGPKERQSPKGCEWAKTTEL